MCRILRLAHLAPTIVEAILEGRHPPLLTMKDLMKPFPLDWREQERWFSQAFVESDRYGQICKTGPAWIRTKDQGIMRRLDSAIPVGHQALSDVTNLCVRECVSKHRVFYG